MPASLEEIARLEAMIAALDAELAANEAAHIGPGLQTRPELMAARAELLANGFDVSYMDEILGLREG